MTSVVAAAAGADVDVVLVRPDRAVLRRPLPRNVTATDRLPFADVLPHVAGIVHHGGSGSTMAALAAGVPARAITAATLERLVADPALASRAREVAVEIGGMPSPPELVELLVALAR